MFSLARGALQCVATAGAGRADLQHPVGSERSRPEMVVFFC